MQSLTIPWSAALSWVGRAIAFLYGRWRRARLKIYFDPRGTYHIRAVVDHNNALGRFCHFMVRNDGKEVARKCRARLMAVSVLTPQGETPAQHFVAPRVLKWAHEPDWEPREIEPGPPGRRADLCYAIDGDPRLYFFTPPVPSGVQTVFPPDNYRVRVRVDSENAGRADATYDIFFNGTWSTISVTPISEP